jgi:hypothetical protein
MVPIEDDLITRVTRSRAIQGELTRSWLRYHPCLPPFTYRPLLTVLTYRPLLTVLTYRPLLTALTYRPLLTVLTYRPLLTALAYRPDHDALPSWRGVPLIDTDITIRDISIETINSHQISRCILPSYILMMDSENFDPDLISRLSGSYL